MRLSEIRGEETLEVMSDLIDPISNIAGDKEITSMIGGGNKGSVRDGLKDAAKLMLRNHKDDVIAILATLDGKTPEEYSEGLTPIVLAKSFVTIINDRDLVDFFTWFSKTGASSTDSSART